MIAPAGKKDECARVKPKKLAVRHMRHANLSQLHSIADFWPPQETVALILEPTKSNKPEKAVTLPAGQALWL